MKPRGSPRNRLQRARAITKKFLNQPMLKAQVNMPPTISSAKNKHDAHHGAAASLRPCDAPTTQETSV
jgi:hypothetical protein